MLSKHDNLVVSGATEAGAGGLKQFRADTGATFPILTGLDAAVSKAYAVDAFPTIRVLDADGKVIGSDMAALEKALKGS
ncbi:MAG: hypothetical protein QNJ98_19325 [Planctomycetota bacterium]|nr:hypothetical protein [Planctomycetota bacterium]